MISIKRAVVGSVDAGRFLFFGTIQRDVLSARRRGNFPHLDASTLVGSPGIQWARLVLHVGLLQEFKSLP